MTIVENDIINRYKIQKSNEFRKVASFTLISNSRIYSAKAIIENKSLKWLTNAECYHIVEIDNDNQQIRRKEVKTMLKIRRMLVHDIRIVDTSPEFAYTR